MDAMMGIDREEVGEGRDSSVSNALDMVQSQSGPLPPGQDSGGASGAVDKLALLADVSAQRMCCGPITQCSGARQENQGDFSEGLASPSTHSEISFSGVSSPSNANATAPLMEMPCSVAASIITDVHGHREDLAREALGCDGPLECFVKTTTIFQALDSS